MWFFLDKADAISYTSVVSIWKHISPLIIHAWENIWRRNERWNSFPTYPGRWSVPLCFSGHFRSRQGGMERQRQVQRTSCYIESAGVSGTEKRLPSILPMCTCSENMNRVTLWSDGNWSNSLLSTHYWANAERVPGNWQSLLPFSDRAYLTWSPTFWEFCGYFMRVIMQLLDNFSILRRIHTVSPSICADAPFFVVCCVWFRRETKSVEGKDAFKWLLF